jgi:hypothetical protein
MKEINKQIELCEKFRNCAQKNPVPTKLKSNAWNGRKHLRIIYLTWD